MPKQQRELNPMAEPGVNPWRDKYLRALEQQDRYQQQAGQQRELLTRALARVSLSADGLDKELDRVLKGLRDALRHQVPQAQLQRCLVLVDDGVKTFETQRRQRTVQTVKALAQLSKQLQGLALPAPLKRELKQFSGGLKARLGHLQELPPALQQLSRLQADALAALTAAAPPKPGLWQRLRSSGPAPVVEADEVDEGEVLESAASPTPDPAGAADPGVVGRVIEGEFEDLPENDSQARSAAAGVEAGEETRGVFERPRHEPAFSRISDRVTAVLTELLDNVEPVPCVQQKVANARQRIDRGLNWYELVPTLEDVRDLVMQAYLAANQTFEDYLQALDADLLAVCEALGIAVDAEQRLHRAAADLQDDVRDQVATLSTSLTQAGDMDALKAQVNAHVLSIQAALDQFQAREQDRPQAPEPPLAEQLKALIQRLETVETQAQQHKQDFEEQRRRALQDPLTELPNREAYNERAHMEFQRWRRYRNPLSLAVCDIDRFKVINDTYGHQAGDRVLKVLSRALAKRLREVDFIARYGGEEFVVLLPETGAADAHLLLDKIRAAIAQTPFRFKEQPVEVTLSIGVEEFRDDDSVESVFARADRLLYRAKEEGRNLCLVEVPAG
ncbi:GGDEF domain-containing protein [Exilibacterium tricleocarpae]|uniref:diguanylate cyclase n=1 Tax=Exilibacterium tricleocarpae TaxID=2591008 RepID=A0A545T0J0_9GAMM|nr:GGDEF domain-containing protein [Exilibacterium tricleocarpae]TQV70738.1 GGDEF domain-containing protein [Exilibacterium tricleocarpae]